MYFFVLLYYSAHPHPKYEPPHMVISTWLIFVILRYIIFTSRTLFFFLLIPFYLKYKNFRDLYHSLGRDNRKVHKHLTYKLLLRPFVITGRMINSSPCAIYLTYSLPHPNSILKDDAIDQNKSVTMLNFRGRRLRMLELLTDAIQYYYLMQWHLKIVVSAYCP